jgi:hypothetical protein
MVHGGRGDPTSKLGVAMVMVLFVIMFSFAAAWCWPTAEELAGIRQSFRAG